MSFPKYPEYKDSGVEWLGEVPAHWGLKKIAWHVPYTVGWTPSSGKEEYYDGDNLWVTIADLNKPVIHDTKSKISNKAVSDRGGRLSPAGSMLFSFKLTVGNVSFLAKPAYTNEAIASFEPNQNVDLNYWSYAAPQFIPKYGRENIYGALLLNQELIGAVRFYAPNIREQKCISRFLDHETARIDALVEEQQRLIELLKEKRQTVISHAVKSFGDGPEGKLGHYIDLLPGYAFPSSGFDHGAGVRLLRGVNVSVGSTRWDDVVYWPYEKARGLDEYWLKEGDLVIGMDRPWISGGARVAKIKNSDLPALLLQRVARVRASSGLDQDFLELVLSSQEFKDSIEADMTGVSVPHISPEQISSYRIALPKLDKQSEIAQEARRELDKLAKLLEEASINISLMQEHRSALISAAVTGKIDVRGWQLPAGSSITADTTQTEMV